MNHIHAINISFIIFSNFKFIMKNLIVFFLIVGKLKKKLLKCTYYFVTDASLFFKYGPMQASFCLFSSFSRHKSIENWKKRRYCAWDSNLGPQDGWRRRIQKDNFVFWAQCILRQKSTFLSKLRAQLYRRKPCSSLDIKRWKARPFC